MPSRNLRFSQAGEVVLDPFQIANTQIQFQVQNLDIEDYDDLGFFLSPATTLGDVDNPSQYPPETDYSDVLDWGYDTTAGSTAQGGLKITVGSATIYFYRGSGDTYRNRIELGSLASGETKTFLLELETPPSVSSRRLHVVLNLE